MLLFVNYFGNYLFLVVNYILQESRKVLIEMLLLLYLFIYVPTVKSTDKAWER